MKTKQFRNPFRPGAGHMPPYLAGREAESQEFGRLLGQDTVLENMVLTGLRGVGKTVLLEAFKPLAIQQGWLWTGTDLSEATSISEENLVIRIMTDLAIVTSAIRVPGEELRAVGFARSRARATRPLDFSTLVEIYNTTPGLGTDKLKAILEFVHRCLSQQHKRGVIFAYDEAQNLADHAAAKQFPLSLLLDTFQSIQRRDIPFMLVLTGLPTLFPKLVEARTFAERMFHVVFLDRLSKPGSRDAILKPIQSTRCPITFTNESVEAIIDMSGGYPYFIQFICREVFDLLIQKVDTGKKAEVPQEAIRRKLDSDFFAGRWARATDRQRELLTVIAHLPNCDSEFTLQEVVEVSRERLKKPFSSSHVNQLLVSLSDAGLVYKNRHGRYSFAVPLLGGFILRQQEVAETSRP